jgi:site-specific recombinase XerD
MASQDRLTLEETLVTFDEHLRRTRGLGAGTRRNYARFVRRFLVAVFDDGPVEVGEIAARDVVGFVAGLTRRWRPRTVEGAATALRSFFRFLRAEGKGCVRTGSMTWCRWCRIARPGWFATWSRGASSN